MTSCSIHDPPWLVVARNDIGRTESLGPNDSPWLRRLWAQFGASWLDGQPWCGGAMAHWMRQCQIAYPKAYYRAREWRDWGIRLPGPCVGAVAILDRPGGAHVTLVEGRTITGDLACLGGNQGDAVKVSPFAFSRNPDYRWPVEFRDFIRNYDLPLIDTTAPRSTNEA
jgi:uncharacterized protein (TIGR02594 family)